MGTLGRELSNPEMGHAASGGAAARRAVLTATDGRPAIPAFR